MKTYGEKINAIIEYFEANEETFNDCIEELDNWNGYLGDDRYLYMEELDELYSGVSPIEILQRAYFGGDEDGGSEFNPNSDYFKYNGYGNLVSTNYRDYSDHLDHYAVEEMKENREYIDSIESDDELSKLFDALEEDEEKVLDAFCFVQNGDTCEVKPCRVAIGGCQEIKADLSAESEE